jgi:ATP-binding cassette subfamily F protein 3
MISFKEISLRRGPKLLLEDASLLVHSGQRLGVIGANGAGKTSLFRLILGELHADKGDISLPGKLRIAHMAQEVVATQRSALDYVLDGDVMLREVQKRIADAEADDNHDRLITAWAELEAIDGHTAVNRGQQLLHGLGFSNRDYERAVADFSGGWRIRLNLARALMCPSGLLLLDEPTNHLDLDATLWLEQWLRAYPGTLMLISHDREFLDAVCTHIVQFEHQCLNGYRGNYSAYELQHAEQLARQQAEYRKQELRRAEMHRFVERFRAKATKAKQAQSRLKALAKMELIAPAHVDSPFRFEFPEPGRASDPLLVMDKAALGYDGTVVLSEVALSVRAGSRLGLLGANGAGKSTLIKSLTAQLPLLDGQLVKGENLRIGYFAQDQMAALDLQACPLLHLQRLSPKAEGQALRDYLGGFGFQGDRVEEPITHFSGGEKARLALALVVWQKPNLLVMDEPTNHLDLEMRHALTTALQQYTGALVVVSHDRHLLRSSVDEFLLVDSGRVSPFEGDLEEYQAVLAAREKQYQRVSGDEKKTDRKAQRRQAATNRERLRPLTRQLQKIEKDMEKNALALQDVESRLADEAIYNDSAKAQLKELLQEQARLKKEAGELEEKWLDTSEQVEALSSAIEGEAE